MGKVIVDMSMSLDGFVAGPNDNAEQPLGERGDILHDWLFSGETPSKFNDFSIYQTAAEKCLIPRLSVLVPW
ncbi:hypothetical protein ACE1TI_00625 [Alteribacillus sp. JSM 102045]|uniref:hypothetical protein n=1 Tax=Alteribacillus sp. JSM 102045 TaxID=1562101 RepID=UPI0035C0BA83